LKRPPPAARRLLASPLLSLSIAVCWLVLDGSYAPAQVLLAALLALVLPYALRRFRDEPAQPHRPLVAMRLFGTVLADIVTSNLQVAALVLGPRSRIESRFIRIGLDLADPNAAALLATIVTMTPGTLSVELSSDRRELTVHCLHAPDPAGIAAAIRMRYEQPLKEIFRC
jgi:multicomponent K+:H+ antiporter subunit E